MMTTDTHPQVFISYSTEDIHFVKLLRPHLEAEQIDYWIDRKDLQPGTPSWEDAIRDAIKNASAVILIASPHSRRSRYVRDEIAIAEMTGRKIYPIWANGDHWIDCVPLGMGQTQYIDLRGDRRFETNFPDLVQAIRSLSPQFAYTPPPVQPLPPGVTRRSPYKGLSAFKEEDKDDFFGRAAAVKELIERVGERVNAKQGRLLAVMGASGSGKSSVVMAGLLPKLKAGAMPGSESWLYIPPIMPGNTPIRALTKGLSRALPEKSFGALEDDLWRANGQGLANLAYTLDKHAILFIDQFEELFMPGVQAEERDQYINLIVQAANEPDGNLTVLLTLRADFYDRPMNYRDLGELITRHQYGLLPMTLSELREAVEAPAMRPDVGLAFEPGLVGEIVFDLRESKDKMALAGALPLLQFTLEQLYERRDTSGAVHTLTMKAYEEIGGVSGAISQHAEAVFSALDEEAQGQLERVFVRLINVDERGEPTRQRALLNDFAGDEAAQRLIGALVNARLLLANRDDEVATLEVAHEALLRNWERLSKWIEQAAEKKRLLQKLEVDAEFWAKRGKPRDQFRYIHEQEVEIESIRAAWDIRFSPLVEEFLQPEIERLIGDLAEHHFSDLTAAEDRILRIGAAAVQPLLTALNNKDVSSSIRTKVAKILGALGNAQAVEPLITALADNDDEVRQSAAEALGALGDARAVEPLIAALADTNDIVRLSAAEALGALGDARAVEPLIAALADTDWGVRQSAAEALGVLGDARAVEPLIAALADTNDWVRQRAAEALRKLGDARAVEPLIATLADTNDWVRRRAAEALGALGDARAVEPLIAALADTNDIVRWRAAEALRKLGDARAVELLIAALADNDDEVRQSAADLLGQLGDARAVEPLIAALADTDWGVRQSAVEALKALRDARTVELLIAALADNDEWVRRTAVEALRKLGDARAVEPFIAALTDNDDGVRWRAAEALGALGDARAVEPLIAALADNNYRVRQNAAEALGKLGDVRAVEPLIAALTDNDDGVRWSVARVLGALGDARAVEPLIAALADAGKWVRQSAAEALGKLGDARAVESLTQLLNDADKDVRVAAQAALARLRGKNTPPDESGE